MVTHSPVWGPDKLGPDYEAATIDLGTDPDGEGDVVTRVGEREVRSSDELVVAVRRAGADTDVPVEVIRDGTEVELTVRPVLE